MSVLILGLFLHRHLGNSISLKSSVSLPSFLVPDKYFEDKKVILAGDFFHTKAAKISSEIGLLEIPYYLAIAEEALAKAHLRQEQMKVKEATDDNDITYVGYNEMGVIMALCLKSVLVILGKKPDSMEDIDKFGFSMGVALHVISQIKRRKTKLGKGEDARETYVGKYGESEIDMMVKLREIVETNLTQAKQHLKKAFNDPEDEGEVDKFFDSVVNNFTESYA